MINVLIYKYFNGGDCIDGDPGLHNEPGTYIKKALRNLNDRRYSCIRPFDVFKLRKKEYGLPGMHKVLYRYYRNFLCYTAARTLQDILDRDFNG